MTVMKEIKSPETIIEEVNQEKMSSGMQAKYYDRDENMWYKQDYLGTEGLSEYVASQLLKFSNISHVNYEPCQFNMGNRKVIGCKSENFLSNGDRLVTAFELIKDELGIDIAKEIVPMELEDRIKYFVDTIVNLTGIQNFGQYLTNLLQLDAVTKNDDRHFNNIAFIVNKDGVYSPAPIYDNGSAFLSDKYTYGENLSEDQILREMDGVLAKPFSLKFDEQLDVCERLYPSTLHLDKNIKLDKNSLSRFYDKEDINKIEIMINQAQRKYSYLFENDYTKEI